MTRLRLEMLWRGALELTLVLSHFLPYRLRRLFLSDNRDRRMNRGAPRRVSGEEWRRLTKESRQRRFGAGSYLPAPPPLTPSPIPPG